MYDSQYMGIKFFVQEFHLAGRCF